MPETSFRTIFEQFKEGVMIDFSASLVKRVGEIENLKFPSVEEFTFRGNSFSWLIRFSDVEFKKDNKMTKFSFIVMMINYNLTNQSFHVSSIDLGDVSGGLQAEFQREGEAFENKMESELLRIINAALRGVK